MKIEATAKDIRALLELADLDRGADQVASETRRQGREAAARRVPRRLLDRYQLLLEVGRTPVVVAIERGGCSGCHVRLPTMLEHQARRSLALYTCPSCRRMLHASGLVSDSSQADDGKARGDASASVGRRS